MLFWKWMDFSMLPVVTLKCPYFHDERDQKVRRHAVTTIYIRTTELSTPLLLFFIRSFCTYMLTSLSIVFPLGGV